MPAVILILARVLCSLKHLLSKMIETVLPDSETPRSSIHNRSCQPNEKKSTKKLNETSSVLCFERIYLLRLLGINITAS